MSEIMNIISAMKTWRFFSIPYIILELIRLAILSFSLVLALLAIKKSLNLGYLIIASIAGGFGLLLLLYFWYCTVAFYNMVSVVKSDRYQKQLLLNPLKSGEKIQKIHKNHHDNSKSISIITLSAKKSKDSGRFIDDVTDLNVTNMFIKEFSGFTGNFRRISENFVKI